MISRDYIEGLAKQVFIKDYLLNGLFPCQSDIVRSIRQKKMDWDFNDKFEYRMLLANTNTGGSLNSQVYKPSVQLIKPGQLEYGVFQGTYGTVTDGIEIDMTANLETMDKKVAFATDFATRMYSLRNNVAGLFKNFAIHGRFGVVHQIRETILAPDDDSQRNPVPNVHTPVLGVPFTIKVPINVFNSNFKAGKYLIKTKEATPWGAADVSEMYRVLDNRPGYLTLVAVGTTVTAWENGQFLEVASNREIVGMPQDALDSWATGGITLGGGTIYDGQVLDQFTGTGQYTSGETAITGAMEGLADLFPWYTNGANMNRLGLDLPFRGQPNRLHYSVEQSGQYVYQRPGQHIIDAIMEGSFLTKATVPYADVGVWMNPVTRMALGYEEGQNVQVIRDNLVAGPIIYQAGVHSVDYQIGNQVIKEVIEDMNMPTDVVIIGPKDKVFYNCWDNATMEIDNFIHETWGKSAPPKIEDLQVPKEVVASINLDKRITYGNPYVADGRLAAFSNGNNIRHPKNIQPMAMHEMGALFTEHPYSYTVVKLLNPITDVTAV